MNKLNNKRIIVVAVCVIAFLALLCRSDNSIAPRITEHSGTTTCAEVDNLSIYIKITTNSDREQKNRMNAEKLA